MKLIGRSYKSLMTTFSAFYQSFFLSRGHFHVNRGISCEKQVSSCNWIADTIVSVHIWNVHAFFTLSYITSTAVLHLHFAIYQFPAPSQNLIKFLLVKAKCQIIYFRISQDHHRYRRRDSTNSLFQVNIYQCSVKFVMYK